MAHPPLNENDPELIAALIRQAAHLPGVPQDLHRRRWADVGPGQAAALAEAEESFELPHQVELDGVRYRIGWSARAPVAAFGRVI